MQSTRPYGELYLQADGFRNPRHLTQSGLAKGEIRELALDIATRGLLYPLLVTSAGLILGGQRRYLAISLIMDWEIEFANLDRDSLEAAALDMRRAFYQAAGIPVRHVEEGADPETTALADNLHREALSSYEIAERLSKLAGERSGVDLARLIGKSRSYVSRALKAWDGSSPELREAWAAGEVAYDTVKELADLEPADQVKALARIRARGSSAKPGPKGDHGRPGISAVKAAHERLLEKAARDDYAAGARDALAFVAGGVPESRLSRLINP